MCRLSRSVLILLSTTPLAISQAAEPLELVTLVGTGEPGYSSDGESGSEAQINLPFGVEVGPDGHLYLCDTGNHVIRRYDRQTRQVVTIAGQGEMSGYSGDGGLATEARLFEPYEVRFDAAGNMFFVEMRNHLVRRVDAQTGVISTIAGCGRKGFSGDGGPAIEAELHRPHSIVMDASGDLYICDIGNHRIRRVDMRSGIISTWCGTGQATGPEDGARISPKTSLKGPRALAVDADGNLWLALREGNRVVKFDRIKGTIHHVAGTGAKGFTGNGGPAAQATLSGPKGIVVDDLRKLVYLADTESHTLRAIDLNTTPPMMQLVAGTGNKGDGADGDPLKCDMARLHGVGLDPSTGEVFIGDSEAHKVRVLRTIH